VTRTCQATVLPHVVMGVWMYVCTTDGESSRNAAKCAANCMHATAHFEGSMHDFFNVLFVHVCVCVCVCVCMCLHVRVCVYGCV